MEIDQNHPAAKPWELTQDDIDKLPKERPQKGRARTQALRNADLVRISSLLLQGANQEEIAHELGISQEMVQSDMKVLNALWCKRVAEDSESFRALMLDKLMKLEALALSGFSESKEKTVTDRSTDRDGGTSTSVKKFFTAGDPAFLNVAKDAIKQQVAVLGLDVKESNIKTFDKEAFLDTVAEKIAEAKLASASVPAEVQELKEIEKLDRQMKKDS